MAAFLSIRRSPQSATRDTKYHEACVLVVSFVTLVVNDFACCASNPMFATTMFAALDFRAPSE